MYKIISPDGSHIDISTRLWRKGKKKKKREQKWFSGFGIVTKYPGLFFHLKILNQIFIKNVKYFIYPILIH